MIYTGFVATIFFLGLVISPLVFWPWAAVPYEIPKVWFTLRWIEVLGILVFIYFFRFTKRKILDGWLIFLVFIFVLWATLTSFWGVDIWKSIVGNYYRSDGLITLYHLVGLFLFVSLFWEKKWRTSFAWAVTAGSFLASLLALVMRESGGSFGNPKFLAGYLLVSLPIPIYLIQTFKDVRLRILLLSSMAIHTLTLALTGSLGGVFGVGLLVAYIIFFCTKSSKRWIVLLGSLFLIFTVAGVYFRMNKERGFVAEGRERIIRRILLGVGKRPIYGWGWANADYAFEAVAWPIPLQHDVYVDKAHSMLLEVLATTGIVGLAIYVGIIVRTFFLLTLKVKNKSHDYWPKILLLVFILYIFHSQTNVISINEEVIFWVIAGIAGSNESQT